MANSITHAALPYPIKNARFTVLVPFFDDTGAPTDPVTPDSEVSKDGGAYADCAEEVTVITGSNGSGYLTLTGAEMDAYAVMVCAKAASGPKATILNIQPRELPVLATGTAQAGGATSITLAANTPPFDLRGTIVKTTGGTGGGGTGGANNQARQITAYDPSTKVATVAPAWETNPSTDTTYAILQTEVGGGISGASLGIIREGTAQGGSSSTIQLDSSASATSAFYVGMVVHIIGGTGAGQSKWIASYDGSTKIATVTDAWVGSAPDSTSVFSIQAVPRPLTDADWIEGGRLDSQLDSVEGIATNVSGYVQDVQARLPAALVSGRIDASVGAYQSGLTPLQPTVAGRTLDVTANGNAGVDWGNVENPGATVDLAATTIDACDDVTGSVGSVTGAVGSVTGSVGSVTGAVGSVTGNVGGLAAGAQSDVRTAVGLASANLDTQLGALDTAIGGLNDISQADVRTAVGLASANLDTQLGALSTAIGGLNDLDSTAVQAAANAALVALHLDHLLAADYDPTSKPGVATALFNELIETDGLGVSRFTQVALEQAPVGESVGGGGGGATAEEIRIEMDANSTKLAAISTALGAAGDGLTDIPWNSAWDAQVESEVADALAAPITESYASHAANASLIQLAYGIFGLLANKKAEGTAVTIYKVDGVTPAMALELNSPTNPTTVARVS